MKIQILLHFHGKYEIFFRIIDLFDFTIFFAWTFSIILARCSVQKKYISDSIHFLPVVGSLLAPNLNLLNFLKSNCELGGTNCSTITKIATKNTTEFNLKPLMVGISSFLLELEDQTNTRFVGFQFPKIMYFLMQVFSFQCQDLDYFQIKYQHI